MSSPFSPTKDEFHPLIFSSSSPNDISDILLYNSESKLSIISLNAWFGSKLALKNINIDFKQNCVTALIGPSGCGKTTLLRCINRMHEMTPNASVKGQIILDDLDIYEKRSDPVIVKRRMGMVFQKPNPFPTMSIYDNVAIRFKAKRYKR